MKLPLAFALIAVAPPAAHAQSYGRIDRHG